MSHESPHLNIFKGWNSCSNVRPDDVVKIGIVYVQCLRIRLISERRRLTCQVVIGQAFPPTTTRIRIWSPSIYYDLRFQISHLKYAPLGSQTNGQSNPGPFGA